MFNCVRSSILTNSVEIFADVHICFVADNFYFLIFEKTKQQNRRIELTKTSFRDVSLSRNGPGRDAGHFFPFLDCPGQSGTSGHPSYGWSEGLEWSPGSVASYASGPLCSNLLWPYYIRPCCLTYVGLGTSLGRLH